MFRFWRTQSFEDSLLGRYKRVRTTWIPAGARTGLSVSMQGGTEAPSPEVVALARQLLREPEETIHAARAFLLADGKARDFMQGNGELVCDGFTVHESGSFAVEFSLSAWPDAMMSVPFEAGRPCSVLLGD
jgi:hypothetical protein